MPRQSIFDDKAAQICWQYLHDEYDKETNVDIWCIVCLEFPETPIAIAIIREIAYRCGYAKSELAEYMSEVTYKKKKKRIRDMLASEIAL